MALIRNAVAAGLTRAWLLLGMAGRRRFSHLLAPLRCGDRRGNGQEVIRQEVRIACFFPAMMPRTTIRFMLAIW